MKLILNVLLISTFIAICYAECDVCTCDTPPPYFTEEFFNEKIKEDSMGNRTMIKVLDRKIENCQVSMTCDFNDDPDGLIDPRMIYYTATDIQSEGLNLNEMKCENGKWVAERAEVSYIGCYTWEVKDFSGNFP